MKSGPRSIVIHTTLAVITLACSTAAAPLAESTVLAADKSSAGPSTPITKPAASANQAKSTKQPDTPKPSIAAPVVTKKIVATTTTVKQPQSRDAATIFAGAAPATVAELKAMQTVMQKLSEKVLPATVGVRVGPAQGSGVIIDKAGHVLTAAHVVGAPGRDVTFILQDGRTVQGKTLGCDYDIDAGLMQITDKGEWETVELADSHKLRIGQWVLATGHPGGYQRGRKPVVRFGRVLTANAGLVATDCTLVGGDSGGPLFDMEGRVVGIHSRIGNSLSANIHVPASSYRGSWDRLVKGEAWGAQSPTGPVIGVVGEEGATDATIAHVNPGSPAERAGIKPGDVVVKFDGQAIANFESLSKAVRRKKPADDVTIEIRRSGKTLELELTVGDRAD